MQRESGLARVSYLPGARPAPPSEMQPAAEQPAEQQNEQLLEAARAEAISLAALGRRDISRAELTARLTADGLSEATVLHEVERLERVGLLDDARLAHELVRRLVERKGQGRAAIAAELGRRRIDPAAITEALASLDSDDEAARALELARKRLAQLHGLDREAAVRRLSGYLQRRGYSGDTVREAVRTVLQDHPHRGRSDSLRAGSSGGSSSVRFE